MKLGVVGLPNVGKSTLFNAITLEGMGIRLRKMPMVPKISMAAMRDSFAAPLEDCFIIQASAFLTFSPIIAKSRFFASLSRKISPKAASSPLRFYILDDKISS